MGQILRPASWLLAGSLAWAAVPVPQVTVAPAAGVDLLRPTGALPVDLVSKFLDPVAFVETSTGEAIVLDRKTSAVYTIDSARTTVHRLLQAGADASGLMTPGALALGPDDLFAVADTVSGTERIQYFTTRGVRVGGFYLPDRLRATRVTISGVAINGIGSLQFGPKSFLVNLPTRGRLVSELGVDGQTLRQFGLLRATGQAPDADLDALLNVGLPLINPTGGFYFVFQTGTPLFRKYDASGQLLFERHIEGPELDAEISTLPTGWRPRAPNEDRMPIADVLVRTAAVDRVGQLWISLNVPVTYVYDPQGNKIHTVQFGGIAPLAARSLFFADRDRVLVTPGFYEFAVK